MEPETALVAQEAAAAVAVLAAEAAAVVAILLAHLVVRLEVDDLVPGEGMGTRPRRERKQRTLHIFHRPLNKR